MVRSRDVVQAEGSARPESVPTTRRPGRAPWRRGSGGAPAGKRDVVLRLLRGESLEALSREVGVEIYRLEEWRERAMAGLELGLKDRHGEPVAEVLDAAKRHIGELSMEIELLRERARVLGRVALRCVHAPKAFQAGPGFQLRPIHGEVFVREQPVAMLGKRRGMPDRVIHIQPDEPPEQQVVVELFHEQPLAPHRVEHLQQ